MKKSITLVVLLFLLLILSGCDTTRSSKAITPPIEVKSEEIINDYIRDQTSAEQKYKNKNVKLTGKVINKGQFKNSSDFFIVTGVKNLSEKTYETVVAYPTDMVKDVNVAKKDDFIVGGIVPQDNPAIISIQIHAGAK